MTVRIVMFGVWALLIFCMEAERKAAVAQIVDPVAPYKSRLTMQSEGINANLTIHRNALGKPCLNFEAASRAHIVNPDVYDNVVSVQNKCSKTINLRICYYRSDSCIDVEVRGRQRKDTVLGIRPHMQYFQYSYKEKF